jgi:6-pyruvoyltetrahydropterin/6-carboxytetrahydropterin synthase
MYRISKKFTFDASHQLSGLPAGHKCARLHGHTYEVELFLEAEGLAATGFVRDYGELDKFKTWLDDTFDHRHLNEFVDQPTAELLAQKIYHVAATWYPELTAVKVAETPKTAAWYMPDVLPIEDRIIAVFENLAQEDVSNQASLREAIRRLLASDHHA